MTLASANGNKLGLKSNKEGASKLAKVFADSFKSSKGLKQSGLFDYATPVISTHGMFVARSFADGLTRIHRVPQTHPRPTSAFIHTRTRTSNSHLNWDNTRLTTTRNQALAKLSMRTGKGFNPAFTITSGSSR